ncbi:MAG TPA: SpoIIE family protein phosphatase [Actinopolymorphaceae bacterium]
MGIAVTSGPEHALIYQNSAHRAIFGDRARGQPLAEAFGELVDIDRYVAMFDEVISAWISITRVDVVLDLRYADEAGRTALDGASADAARLFSLGLTPVALSDTPGGATRPGVLLFVTEVTDRVLQAERTQILGEAQRRVTQRYRTLGKAGAHIVVVCDAEGYVKEESPGWEAVTGQSFEEFRGAGWLQAVHPDDRQGALAVWQGAVADVPTVWEHVLRIRTASREYRHFRVRGVPVFENEELVEWIGMCTDIEDQLMEGRRTRLLERASAATRGLAQPHEMLAALADVIVPMLADSCRVYVVRDDPPRPRDDEPYVVVPIATAIADGLRPLTTGGPETRARHTMFGRAIRQRRPSYSAFAPGAPPFDTGNEGVREWLASTEATSLVCLPIIVDGTVVAVAVASVCGSRPTISAVDVRLMTEIFEHAHDALSSAASFRRTQQIALALQRSMLTRPPRVPGLTIAARYQPASVGAEVGGDWYDCFVLPDGSTILSIGDVAGHDLRAAVTMGQVRTILRGLAVDRRESSGEILRRLDTALQTLYGDSTATCVLARVEGRSDRPAAHLDYAVAGHPPPLLIDANGETRYLDAPSNQLLGVAAERGFESASESLDAGGALLFYTDGLIERPDEPLEHGLARLERVAGRLVLTGSLERFCDELLANLPVSGHDDVAMIAVRVTR